MVELVYKFEEKSTTSVSKGKLITKVPFIYIYIYIYIYNYKWVPEPIT